MRTPERGHCPEAWGRRSWAARGPGRGLEEWAAQSKGRFAQGKRGQVAGGRAREAPWAGHGSGLLLSVVHLFPPFSVSQAHLTMGFRPSSATGRPWWKTGRQGEGTSRTVSPRPSQRSLAFHGGGGGVPWSLQLPTRRSRPPRSQPPAWRRGFRVSRLASLQPRGGSGSLLSVASHPLFMQQNPWMTIPCFEYLTLFH